MISDPQQTAADPGQRPASSGKGRFLRTHLVYAAVIAALLVVIGGMYLTQQPWFSGQDNNRTVTVTGKATLKAEPDLYQFSPAYSVTGLDQNASIAQLSAKSDEVIDQLKKLGVAEKDIKTSAGGYDFPIYYRQDPEEKTQFMLNLQVVVTEKELAQKVQDYLITTGPVGTLTPYVTFSVAKSKELEDMARTEAIKDARQKAEKMASELGFNLRGVKQVSSGDQAMPYIGRAEPAPAIAQDSSQKLGIYPGENEYTYSFSVEYYIR